MSNSVVNKLALVRNLINEGKEEEALQYVKEIEHKETLKQEEMLKSLVYKGWIYFRLGKIQLALKVSDELYQKSQEMEMHLFSLDSSFLKGMIFYITPKLEDFYKILEQAEKIFKSIPRDDSLKYQEREALILLMKGLREFNIGNLNFALSYYNKSLALFERFDPQSRLKTTILMGMAYAYETKGELNLALKFNEKALSIIPERGSYSQLLGKATIYRSMGAIFHQKGDFDSALEYYMYDLEIMKKIRSGFGPRAPYFLIIRVLLDKKDINQARDYLQQYKEFSEKYESKENKDGYQFSCALVLKASSRIRDHFKAETILKKLGEENPQSPISDYYSYNIGLTSLCELYFEEFQLSNQMEVLDEIPPLINMLQKIAKLQSSFSLSVNVKLLQAKLALLQINLVEARKLLTEAQQIADEHGLQLLASEISKEHDRLLEELKLWESFKNEQASAAERLKLASVNTVIERMQGRRAIEPPEIISEEPILLIIMGKDGVSYFNYSFIQNWDFDDLFSAFVSAFNTFSSEIFSKSIDRIKIDENVILIKPIEPYLICYVIKGQSYPAQKKLTRFSDSIRNDQEIWEALNRAAKTSEMLELDNPPSLGSTVNEIFIN